MISCVCRDQSEEGSQAGDLEAESGDRWEEEEAVGVVAEAVQALVMVEETAEHGLWEAEVSAVPGLVDAGNPDCDLNEAVDLTGLGHIGAETPVCDLPEVVEPATEGPEKDTLSVGPGDTEGQCVEMFEGDLSVDPAVENGEPEDGQRVLRGGKVGVSLGFRCGLPNRWEQRRKRKRRQGRIPNVTAVLERQAVRRRGGSKKGPGKSGGRYEAFGDMKLD